ncbi:hypothetical protein D9757_008784 [Collybiopsis confluens]|uniref:Uncharacterized protein n=1 Tax=Collybiopsis confluens TaxID=2823264 RepID=A0A8H5M176_9AGAR|nr:hypothetical protein D9757_008784 [Collybiopsis confluens]
MIQIPHRVQAKRPRVCTPVPVEISDDSDEDPDMSLVEEQRKFEKVDAALKEAKRSRKHAISEMLKRVEEETERVKRETRQMLARFERPA